MLPTLYTSKHCPFCARTHATLIYSDIELDIKYVDLNNLPKDLLDIKKSASVPFLVLTEGEYLDESWDIMQWALKQNDPDNWLGTNNTYVQETDMLIETYDYSFYSDYKSYRDAKDKIAFREDCEEYIKELEELLNGQKHLVADQLTVADIAITPVLRLLSLVEPDWFRELPYPKFHAWLKAMQNKPFFTESLATL